MIFFYEIVSKLKSIIFLEKKLYVITFLFSLAGLNNYAFSQNFAWAKQFGGASSSALSLSIAVDANGNSYTTGAFGGVVDFDPGAGTYQLTAASTVGDIFVSKLDASGNFIWAKRIGNVNSSAQTYSVAVDASGNVFISGTFYGTVDFDPGTGIYNLSAAGGYIFIARLDASGNFVWAKQIGGGVDFDGAGWDLTVDANSNVYTTGNFRGSADFDPGGGVYFLTSVDPNQQDAFVSKLDVSGNFIWAKKLGGADREMGISIAVDVSGNVYTTGYILGVLVGDFDPGPGVYNLAPAGVSDIYISKLDPSGNFVWAKLMGATGSDNGYSIAVDANGNVYTAGTFNGTVDFDPGSGTFNLTSVTSNDFFISKLDASGNFVWAKQIGVPGDYVSIFIDANSYVYIASDFFASGDFDPGPGTFILTSAGQVDVFLSKLDVSGNFVWAKQMGGSAHDWCHSGTVDANGNVYLTGWFEGTGDFDPGPGVYNLTPTGNPDGFVVKLGAVTTGVADFNNFFHSINIFPNPVSTSATISFSLARSMQISFTIFDEQGKIVSTVAEKFYAKGDHKIVWNALWENAGVYFLRMQSANAILTRKIIVVR